MSKMDGLRAMREARYAEMTARAAKAAAGKPAVAPVAPPVASPGKATQPAKAARAPEVAAVLDAPGAAAEALCGHRAISGRTCTREQGHAAKSHRYA